MAIEYQIFAAEGAGVNVDYGTVFDTVSATAYTFGPIGPSGHVMLAVRARDTVTGLVERNVDCFIRFDEARGFLTNDRPIAPQGVTVDVQAAGTARVRWAYLLGPRRAAPTGFKVWKTTGATVNFGAAPAATIAWDGQPFYETTLSGIAHGTQYAIGIRAYDAEGDDGNEVDHVITGDTTAPAAVTGLTATATFSD